MKYLYNPPFLVKKVFSSFRWNTTNGKILFTFDDGPLPGNTEKILKKLDELKIKAAFFCVGDNVRKYPELTRTILDEGHLVGNHTFNHKNIRSLNREETINQVKMANDVLQEKCSYLPGYFRPPYGKFRFSTPTLLKQMDLTAVLWSLLTYDYKNDFEIVKTSVKKYLQEDSIIVLHDSIKSAGIILDSIRFAAEEADKKGYKTGNPAECLR
jgi:peptidoglycan/xylan/chitin deacetylase (PgdA/CDA1 family)